VESGGARPRPLEPQIEDIFPTEAFFEEEGNDEKEETAKSNEDDEEYGADGVEKTGPSSNKQSKGYNLRDRKPANKAEKKVGMGEYLKEGLDKLLGIDIDGDHSSATPATPNISPTASYSSQPTGVQPRQAEPAEQKSRQTAPEATNLPSEEDKEEELEIDAFEFYSPVEAALQPMVAKAEVVRAKLPGKQPKQPLQVQIPRPTPRNNVKTAKLDNTETAVEENGDEEDNIETDKALEELLNGKDDEDEEEESGTNNFDDEKDSLKKDRARFNRGKKNERKGGGDSVRGRKKEGGTSHPSRKQHHPSHSRQGSKHRKPRHHSRGKGKQKERRRHRRSRHRRRGRAGGRERERIYKEI